MSWSFVLSLQFYSDLYEIRLHEIDPQLSLSKLTNEKKFSKDVGIKIDKESF